MAADELLAIYSEGPSASGTSLVVATLRAHLDTIKPGDYVALLRFIESTPQIDEILQRIRTLIRDHTHCAITVGYGPRFLHSTGQFHKGWPKYRCYLSNRCGRQNRFAGARREL